MGTWSKFSFDDNIRVSWAKEATYKELLIGSKINVKDCVQSFNVLWGIKE